MLGELFIGTLGGIATNIATAVFRHVYATGKAQAYQMRILSGEVGTDPVQEVADLLQISLAKAGLLNTACENAIKKLITVGIIQNLCDACFSDLNPDYTFQLIDKLLVFEKENLTDGFSSKLFLSIREIISKSKFFDNPQDRRRADQRFRTAEVQIAKLLKSLDDNVKENNTAAFRIESVSEYQQFMAAVAEVTRLHLDEIDIHGASGEISKASLENIFVDCPVYRIEKSQVSTFRERVEADALYEFPAHIGWKGILNFGQRIVLLGDPGGGKSTHTRKICCEVASRTIDDRFLMPLFVQLRTYAAAKKKDNISLFNFMISLISDICIGVERENIERYFFYNISVGRSLIVFDGLDEVLSEAIRLEISREINSLTKRFSLSTFIVTSRFVGYEVAPLDAFTHVAIGRLGSQGISDLHEKVCRHILGMTIEEVARKRAKFLKAANEKAKELISNPLLLTLIIIVEHKRREIPDNRADLYSMCASLLFDRWDRLRDINPDLPERYRLNDLLIFLSHKLYEEEAYGGRIKRDELLKLTKDFFIKDYIDNKEGRASEASYKFVDHLTGRAWILHEVGENIFEFSHRTFMEYFYAKYIEAKNENTSDIFTSVLPSILLGQRTVPAHLAFQMRSKDNRLASTKIARLMSEAIKQHGSNQLVEFSAQAARYLLPTADELDEWIGAICSKALDANAVAPLIVLFSNDGPLNMPIRLKVCASLSSIGDVSKLAKFRPLFSTMRSVLASEEIVRSELQSELDKALSENFAKMQIRSPFVTKLFFDLGLPYDVSAASKHGLRLWANNKSSFGNDTGFSDAIKMLNALLSGDVEIGSEAERYRNLAVALVADRFPWEGSGYDFSPHQMEWVPVDFRFNSQNLGDLTPAEFRAALLCVLVIVECMALIRPHYISAGIDVNEFVNIVDMDNQHSDLRPFLKDWLSENLSLFKLKYRMTPRELVVRELAQIKNGN
ncbi:NACHT domain-containing protein [Rhizobium cremeum]|uniref:NACHT domain-containing protein n=1 Tax=Rhizobium cremeum TaxID=2813827 RepID=UPI001FD28580|nr:NACHT domain-containing protein [Rhizobium cremeum]MCJ7997890.1 NACHT domain-containing protein [Rhizobium cremeum]MCJ8002984.1 NACHT domain-containing protein [Rhizobium cremeum]